MKNFYIFDDATTARAEIYKTKLADGLTEAQAISAAACEWDKLSDYDKANRDAFELIQADEDEDGNIDLDTATVIRRFKLTGKWIIRDREAGNVIEEEYSLEAARDTLRSYEETDRIEGTYTPDFYEIVDPDGNIVD